VACEWLPAEGGGLVLVATTEKHVPASCTFRRGTTRRC
jgi:hypothetical protein